MYKDEKKSWFEKVCRKAAGFFRDNEAKAKAQKEKMNVRKRSKKCTK